MAYKDKDKQREAVREATRRYRAKLKGITYKVVSDTPPVIPVIPIAKLVNSKVPKQQSYNPMMVGYVPPYAIAITATHAAVTG